MGGGNAVHALWIHMEGALDGSVQQVVSIVRINDMLLVRHELDRCYIVYG